MDEVALGSDLNFRQRLIFQSRFYATAATIQPLCLLILELTPKMLSPLYNVYFSYLRCLVGHPTCLSFCELSKYTYRSPVSPLRQVAILFDCKLIMAPPSSSSSSATLFSLCILLSWLHRVLFVNTTSHSLLLFLFNASPTICANNDFLLDTLSLFHSFTLSFFLSFIPRCATQPNHTHSTLCSCAAQQLLPTSASHSFATWFSAYHHCQTRRPHCL